jgi:hypothetical protein
MTMNGGTLLRAEGVSSRLAWSSFDSFTRGPLALAANPCGQANAVFGGFLAPPIVEERLGGYQLAASSARAGPQDTCAFRPKALISPQE